MAGDDSARVGHGVTGKAGLLAGVIEASRDLALSGDVAVREAAARAWRDGEALIEIGRRDVRTRNLDGQGADAVIVDAVALATTSLADTHRASGTHPAVSIIPVLRHVADLPEERVLSALVAGYEACGRMGMMLRSGAADATRMTSLAGSVGAAVAAAVALDMDEGACIDAAAFALQAANGRNAWAFEASDDEIVHAVFAAHSAGIAVSCARAGLRGARSLVEHAWGFGIAAAAAVGTRTQAPVIHSLFHKRFAACLFAQTSAELAAESSPRGGVPARIRISPFVARYPGCANVPTASDPVQARIMNVRLTAAAAALGAFGVAGEFDVQRMTEICDLASSIELVEDSTLDDLEVSLETTSGEVTSRAVPRGLSGHAVDARSRTIREQDQLSPLKSIMGFDSATAALSSSAATSST